MRRPPRPLLAAATVLLLLPAALATQPGGDAQRTGLVSVPDGPLDVLGNGTLLEPGERIGLTGAIGLVDRGDDLAAVVQGDGCDLLFVADLLPPSTTRVDVPLCETGMRPVLAAYDAARDRFIVCHESMPTDTAAGGRPVVAAIEADGSTAWTLTPAAFDGAEATWTCGNVALDPLGDRLVVAATGLAATNGLATAGTAVDHAVLGLDPASGEARWHVRMDAGAAASGLAGLPRIAATGDAPDVRPRAVVLTASGAIATGIGSGIGMAFGSVEGALGPVAYAVPGAASTAMGVPEAPADVPTGAPSAGVSAWGAAQGEQALLGLGDAVVRLDPRTEGVERLPVELGRDVAWHPTRGALWWSDLAVLPLADGLLALDVEQDMAERWSRQLDGVQDVALAAPERLFVLASSPPRLERLDAFTGRTVHAVPVNASILDARLTPWGGGLLALDERGAYTVFGTGTGGPAVSLSEAYPRVGERIEVKLRDAGNAVRHEVYWGDGGQALLRPGEPAGHAYQDLGLMTLSVTAVRADGTTATTESVVDVGGEAPPTLNRIQRWFAPDNQDMAWGVLGLVLGGLGAIWGIAVRGGRRYRLGKDLGRVQELRTLAVDEPLQALQRLRTYRADARARARKGRIDEAHYAAISAEANGLAQSLQQRVLALFRPKVAAPTWGLIEAALADGVFTDGELDEIERGLAGERLAPHERRALVGMLADWR